VGDALDADQQHARMSEAYDFFSDATRDDPFPLFHRLRERNPVYETDFGYWYVSRYDDVVRLLRDTRLTSGRGVPDSLGVTGGPLREIMDAWMMALDGPEHRRARDLISRAFSPRAVEALRPAIEAAVVPLVDRLVVDGGGDLVECLAFPLPMEVTRLLFGVDPAEWDRDVVALFDPRRRSGRRWVDDMQRLTDALRRALANHRDGSVPPTGLFVALGATDDDGVGLTELEQLANAVLLVTAGFETTMGLLTNAVRALLLHPEQLALLLDDPSRAASAVDEVLRFEPPALFTTRYTTEAIEVAGTVIPAQANVMFSSVAANRDPARYPDPDRFDITRRDIRPVTFGGGVHSCIGSALARVEAEIVLTKLFAAVPALELVPPVSPFQSDNPSVRMPEHLYVSTGASERAERTSRSPSRR
jgi:cytochrome P450